MDSQNLLLARSKTSPQTSDLFRYFARPMTSKLLETMEISKHFHHGEGDYLFYEQNGKTHKVLDLTGGYGANLLGHRNPRIMAKLLEWHAGGAPNLTQGSVRRTSGVLAKRISDTLQSETGEGPWITTFSNSGTEAVEAALKHCLIYFQHKLIALEQEIDKEINLALLTIRKRGADVGKLRLKLSKMIPELRMTEERKSYFLHQISNALDIHELVALVREINALQMQQRPSFISLEKAYHGKTMGALTLTASENFRNPFYLDEANNLHTHFISQYIDAVRLDQFIQDQLQDLIVLANSPVGVTLTAHSFSMLAGAFVEPIQGEAGVIPVSDSFLALLKKYSLQQDFLLVFDEIQAGMYRTGKMASGTHSAITPDIYTFSKSLGGGVAKIAATVINQRKYVEEFGLIHTSTFSDDDLSSIIALEVLEVIQGEGSPLEEAMQSADYLAARLQWLLGQYPDVVSEIRGKGLMLAIEFKDLLPGLGFEFKTICDARMQGYLYASALLNKEGLRMSPSLSNHNTLRIAPSMYFGIVQAEELISGLIKLCQALRAKDIAYFLSCLYPNDVVKNERTPNFQTIRKPGNRPLAVFLCHIIDEAHAMTVTRALTEVPGHKILNKLALAKDLATFEVNHTQTLKDKNGQEMDIMLMAIPVTSEELKKSFMSRNKYKIVQKVQAAVDYAKELGANTVGLGQFTSIVSGNGLYLNPRGMNLTTGNSFTTALMVQAALRSVSEKNVDLKNASAALIGAAGNIMSVATSLMADHVGKLILIHHSPVDSSIKYQEAVKRILADIAVSDAESKVVTAIKKHWQENLDLVEFLKLEEIKEVLLVSSDINDIKGSDLVLCGTSASTGFLSLDLFKQNSVVVDVAVPPSIRPEMLEKIEAERPDLTYHLGGVASIPNGDSIDFFVFPLGENECYACMAETFSIGFSGRKNILNIGDLSKSVVMEVQKMAAEAGFVLGKYKSKASL